MVVCLQSGGLIDTGSLSVQDGLQLNQFGIHNNSPNLPISSEREQAQIVSTFWMFSLSFLSVEPHYRPHFSLFAFCSSVSLSVFLSRLSLSLLSPLTLCLLPVFFSFLFHLSFLIFSLFLLLLFSLSSLHSSLSLSVSVCSCIFALGIGCRHSPVLALYN